MKLTQKWLNEFYNSGNIELSDLPHVLEFVLLWNVFESTLITEEGMSLGLKDIEKSVYSLTDISSKSFYDDFVFLKRNTIKPNSIYNIGDVCLNLGHYTVTMEFKKRDEKFIAELLKIIENTETKENDQLFFILAIAYRLRNNLFHGNKMFQNLVKQNELFKSVFNGMKYLAEKKKLETAKQ